MASVEVTFDKAARARLIGAFEGATLSEDEFHHLQHVQVAWAILQDSPMPEALARITSGLRRLTTALGAAHKYHETITVFLVLLIHERIADAPDESWMAFADRNRDLLESSRELLRRYYRDETLQSARAKAIFVLPDRGIELERSETAR